LSVLFFLFVACFILWLLLSLLFKNKISGFTGDCLGTANVVTELIILLFYARIST
jgi:cobalamin synthase